MKDQIPTLNIQIDRRPRVLSDTGWSKSILQIRINEGLFPPGINLSGGRAVGWAAHEKNAVIAAMVAGKSQTEIKVLVKSLVSNRQEIFKSLTHNFMTA